MITPRRTRLVRVPDLYSFRRAISVLIGGGDQPCLVVVPTRGASRQLRLTLARLAHHGAGPENGGDPVAPAIPDFVTRDQLYESLYARLPYPPRRLTAFERDGITQAAAADAARTVQGLPFRVRPGLVAEILRFYDHLRRQSQSVNRFEELIEEALGGGGATADRGTERMLRQTRFLADTFRGYERRLAACGACDEHGVRERLVTDSTVPAVRRVVVTIADWIADPAGLFPADFDMLARMPRLDTIDIVCTDAVLGSGFHERLHNWWPGLEEVPSAEVAGPAPAVRPTLLVPSDVADAEQPWFTYRDREEELVATARRVAATMGRWTDGRALDRVAVVFKRPLPYLYLAPETLGAAGIPYQTYDALPLAAQPAAAPIDLLLDVVETRFARDALISLLRTPHLRFTQGGIEISAEAVGALDRVLCDARYLGDLSRLEAIAAGGTGADAGPALEAALTAARALSELLDAAPASCQLRRVLDFLSAYARPLAGDDRFAARERRARVALTDLLAALADAHEVHHDPPWTIDDVAAAVRRWVGDQTFLDEPVAEGMHLLDDQAAPYGEFDEIALVGLSETEWPEPSRRNIFYPPGLLRALGWPSEKDRRGADEARFVDLLASASNRVTVSTFTLDDEAIVGRSMLLDEIPRARLSTVVHEQNPPAGIFRDEAMTADPPGLDALPADARDWVELRVSRSSREAPGFHGSAGPQPARQWSVSALETYLACPFKFFAQHVLSLEEEADDEEVMNPRQQGQFVHEVFEGFFSAWQKAGRGAVTPANLAEARALFVEVVDRALTRLPDAAEASLERTRLLGSPAAAGLGEAVLRMEAERPVAVVERFLEHRLSGELAIPTASGTRVVAIRGKADRLDLLEDGTFRLIDYKLGWPPDRGRALQLPIYALCAEERLQDYRGRRWTLGEAVYLAFKGPKRVVPLFSSSSQRDDVLDRARRRLADTVDAVERGEFPPRPDDVFRCESCSFAAVCRKDYVGDV